MKYELDKWTFPTKKAAREAVQQILYASPPGAVIPGDGHRLLLALLARHPDAAQKVGCGVQHFEVRTTDYGNLGFYLVRTDGTGTDWSYLHCLTPRSPKQDLRAALRQEIEPQIIEFRRLAFDGRQHVTCALTGISVHIKDAHIDHSDPTFEDLVLAFMSQQGVDVGTIDYLGFGDNEQRKGLADRFLAARWQVFHKERAVLRVVTQAANLGRRRK